MMEQRRINIITHEMEQYKQFDPIGCIGQQVEEQLLSDYYWCRAHHRQMWSAIARLDDKSILRYGFRISAIKAMVGFHLGYELEDLYRYSLCYACFWTKGFGRNCNVCPIKRNLGDDCSYNAYNQLVQLSDAYASLECSARTNYWKDFLETFRSLALEMTNAW